MRPLLIGTNNRHKTAEIARLLLGLPYEIHDLTEFPGIPPVEENGETLLENSRKKAKNYGADAKMACLADDTGLEVEALDGEPGVYSARYAGEGCTYKDNCVKLLQAMEGVSDRKAVFKTVISFYDPANGIIESVEGVLEGEIATEFTGSEGFGYDPIFYVPELKKTLAQMTLDEKNGISHRGRAVLKMKDLLKRKNEQRKP